MNSDSRKRVLERIREAARSGPPRENQETRPARSDTTGEGRLIDRGLQEDERVTLFLERAASSGAQACIVTDREALKGALDGIVPDDAGVAVACNPGFLEELGLAPSDLLPEGCRLIEAGDQGNEGLFGIDAAITDADLAVAETGSIVLRARDDRARLASLVAVRHIVLVRPGQIVPDLIDWARRPASGEGASPPRAMTMITGPSKTADIEIKLVVGVHGPAELHLLVLGF